MIIIDILIAILMLILTNKFVDDNRKKIEHEIKEAEPVKIVIEIINNNYYAWKYNSNEFIMQSSTKDYMLEELKKKFPNKNINLLSKEKIEWVQKK